MKKQKLLKIMLYLTSFLLMLFFNTINSRATTGPEIAINPEYSSSQIEKVGYYFLQTKPNKTQVITLKVTNLSLKKQIVKVIPTDAITSDSGKISYDPTIISHDHSLKYNFTDLFSEKSKKVTIPENSTVNVKFNLTPPKKSYSGIIMGGLYVVPNYEESKVRNKINNHFALIMPVQLRENKSKIVPNLAIDQVKLCKNNSQTELKRTISNSSPNTITGMKFSDKIYQKGKENKIIIKHKYNDFSMAPNSNFNLISSLNDKILLPGVYCYEINASDDSGNNWKVIKTFRINLTESARYTTSHNWWNLIIMGLFLVLVILVYIIWKRRKNR